jgi:hypothetical protein
VSGPEKKQIWAVEKAPSALITGTQKKSPDYTAFSGLRHTQLA